MVIEICTTHLPSALAARAAGAQRIELCAALDVGGITPSPGLIRQAVARLDIPIHVLIRPREGDFCYAPAEVAAMADDILFCREVGAAGVVIGALDDDQYIDFQCIEKLMAAARGMDVTFHRAFDFVKNTQEALAQLIEMGFERVLTSGGYPTAYAGRFALQALVQQAAGRITIMPGAGITSANIAEIQAVTGTSEFHLSAKKKAALGNNLTNLRGLEVGHWEVDEEEVQRVVDIFRVPQPSKF